MVFGGSATPPGGSPSGSPTQLMGQMAEGEEGEEDEDEYPAQRRTRCAEACIRTVF